MSKTLYIIGNGFDKAHSMPVGYGCFKHYLENINGSQPECANCMYCINGKCKPKTCFLLSLLNTAIRDKENWSDFEEALAKIDFTILSDINSYPKFDELIDNFSACLQEAFHSWINNIVIPPSECLQFKFDTFAYFITFNYTMTLEQMYGINPSDIYHIHYSTKGQEEEGDNYVFGHSSKYKQIREYMRDRIKNLDESVVDEWCFALLRLSKTDFMSLSIIPELQGILHNNFSKVDIETPIIKIIGHSFGKVDFDYFDEIRKLFPLAKWVYYYHSNDALCEAQNRINEFKKEKGNINISYEKLSTIMIHNIQYNNQTHTIMKKEQLHLQILSYLKDQNEIVNLEKVFEKFLGEKQGLLIQNDVSECRGHGCFQRMSAILFAINRLQEDRQITLAHIEKEVVKDYSEYCKNPRKIGNADFTETESKVTGYYQNFLKEHILSTIYVADEADEYIKRKGVSKELQQAKIQTTLALWAVIIAILTLAASVVVPYFL